MKVLCYAKCKISEALQTNWCKINGSWFADYKLFLV